MLRALFVFTFVIFTICDSYNIIIPKIKSIKKIHMMNENMGKLSSLSDSVKNNNWMRKSSFLIGTVMLSGLTLSRNAYGDGCDYIIFRYDYFIIKNSISDFLSLLFL